MPIASFNPPFIIAAPNKRKKRRKPDESLVKHFSVPLLRANQFPNLSTNVPNCLLA